MPARLLALTFAQVGASSPEVSCKTAGFRRVRPRPGRRRSRAGCCRGRGRPRRRRQGWSSPSRSASSRHGRLPAATHASSSARSVTPNDRWSRPIRVSSNTSLLPARCSVRPMRDGRLSWRRKTFRNAPSGAWCSPARRKPRTSTYHAALASASRTVKPRWWIPLITAAFCQRRRTGAEARTELSLGKTCACDQQEPHVGSWHISGGWPDRGDRPQ
jgi:hypothetical protein